MNAWRNLMAIVLALMAAAATLPAFADVDALLREIAAYEYGDSLEAQMAMDTVIREALGARAPLGDLERRFIALLQSDATLPAKQYACMKLGEIGGDASLPVLGKMLVAPDTSDMARLALQRIPGNTATQTLLDALPALAGPHRIGVIGTLGERGDAQAVPVLEELVGEAVDEESLAAVAALGRIGGDKAEAALRKVHMQSRGDLRLAASDACLQCADHFMAQNKRRKAAAIYRRLDSPDETPGIRAAALRGHIASARGPRAADIIIDTLQHGDPAMQTVAAVAVRNVASDRVVKRIAANLSSLDAAVQVKLIAALADRASGAAESHLIAAADSADPDVRLAALRALAACGDADAVLPLAQRAAAADGAEARVARESLARSRGPKADAAIVNAIPKADTPMKRELIRAAGARGNVGAAKVLLDCAQDDNAGVRAEAHAALRAVAAPEILPGLVSMLTQTGDPDAVEQIQESIAIIAARIPDENDRPAAVLKAIQTEKDASVKVRLLVALGWIGSEAGLPALREALQEDDPALNLAVIESLGVWPNDAPMGDLAYIADKHRDAPEGAAALRGYIRMIGLNPERPVEETVAHYQRALALATNAEDKETALAGLGATKADAALPILYAALDDPTESLRNAAIRALSDWPNPAPMDALGDVARTAAGTTQGALALGGYVRLVGLPGACAAEDAARRYEEAMQLAANADQKKTVLGALANTGNIAALRMAAAHLRDAELKAEAEVAAVKIAANVSGAYPQETKAVLAQIMDATDSDFVKGEAEKILAQIARFEQYITAWMAAGPYAAEGVSHAELFDMPFPPEQADAAVSWQAIPPGTNPDRPFLIELDKFYGGNDRAAYLRSYVWSETACDAVLELGSDDGIKVWLNGEVVHANNVTRGCTPNEDTVPVRLPAGWSTLLLKVTQGAGEWSACARLRTPDSEPLDGWRAALSPE